MAHLPELPHHLESETGHPTYQELPREELSREIEEISAEGIPADPAVGPRQIGIWILVCVGAIVVAGLIASAIINPALGITLIIGSLVVFAFNPELWANLQRAKERREAQVHIERAHHLRRF